MVTFGNQLVFFSRLRFSANLEAARRCLSAHPMAASGTNRARSRSPARRNASLGHLSSGIEMFGCIETGTQEDSDDATAHNVPEGPAPIRIIAGERSDLKLALRDNRW